MCLQYHTCINMIRAKHNNNKKEHFSLVNDVIPYVTNLLIETNDINSRLTISEVLTFTLDNCY